MSSIKHKFCEKIGITEASIKSNSIFSDIKSNQSLPTEIKSIGIKVGSSNKSTAHVSKSMSGFEHSKMDILVPNSQPPTPQIRTLKTESRYVCSPDYKNKRSNDLDSKLQLFSPANSVKKRLNTTSETKSKL